MRTNKTYPPRIQAYEHACDEILGWMPDWLSQHDFDRLSREHNPSGRRAVYYTPETVLPPFLGDQNLALLQEMQRAGIVSARSRKGVIYYRAVPDRN